MAKVICWFLCLLYFIFGNCQLDLLTNVADSINHVLRPKRNVEDKVPSCTTVNNMPARCVDLVNQCPTLYEVATTNRNNPKFVNTLKQLQCGLNDDKNPRVCCPLEWIPKVPSARTELPRHQTPTVTTMMQSPVTRLPVTEPPVTELPVTEPLVTEPPVTEPPVTQPSVTQPPVTEPSLPEEDTCKSLNSGYLPGQCVSLLKCPSLYKKAIESSQDPVVRNEMFRIHCGWVDNNPQQPQVCCPFESIATLPPTQPTDELRQGDAPSQDSGDFVDILPSPPDCGPFNLAIPRVVGGSPAVINMFPWMALLGYRRRWETKWRCGGSLISTRHVLTAAHCINGEEKNLFKVRLGELDLVKDDDGAIDIPIKKWIIHEQFVQEINDNDIGILTLATEVIYTDLIRPICMPTIPDLKSKSFEKTMPFLAGWGQIKFGGKTATDLQFIQIPVTNTAECSKIYKKDDETFKTLDNRSLCAGYKEGRKDACSGDSGGPLMHRYTNPETRKTTFYQIGIISYGKSCGAPGYPGIFVRVTEYIPWIVKQTTGKIIS